MARLPLKSRVDVMKPTATVNWLASRGQRGWASFLTQYIELMRATHLSDSYPHLLKHFFKQKQYCSTIMTSPVPSFLTHCHYVIITHVNLTTNKTTHTVGGPLTLLSPPAAAGGGGPRPSEDRRRRHLEGREIVSGRWLAVAVGSGRR